MKYLLDLIPLVVFFIIYKKLDIFYASGVLMFTNVLTFLVNYIIYKKIQKRSLITLIIVISCGSLTLIFHNDIFIKWKVTILYIIFSFSLLFSQFFMKKPLIQKMLEKDMHLSNKFWGKLNLSWAIFFAICGLINIYVALWFSQEVWVNFKVFGLTIITVVFGCINIIYIYKHLKNKQQIKF